MANSKSRPIVRLEELQLVLELWLSGESYEEIFAALPSNKRSSRRPSLDMWLEGVPGDSTWTDQFAKFHDFMNNCVTFFLPWILRAARPLSEFDKQPDRPWSVWANYAELGIDSTWGALLMDGDVIADRTSARQIGKLLDELESEGEPTVEQVRRILMEPLEGESGTVETVLNWFRRRERPFPLQAN